jgi:phospholipase/lecithinase/hemolysin
MGRVAPFTAFIQRRYLMRQFKGFCSAWVLAALLGGLTASAAQAAPSKIVAFGDSLSDTGNVLTKFANAQAPFNLSLPASPYWEGRFSNGPVAVEVMATALDVELQSYAYGGALTGTANRITQGGVLTGTGVQSQISSYLQVSSGSADANALFVLWAGGNDFFSAPVASTVTSAVNNLVFDINQLYAAGGRQFIVPNLPDLADTADSIKAGGAQRDLAHALTLAFNDTLRIRMTQLQAASPGASIQVFDAYSVLKTLRGQMESQGLNVSQPCYVGDFLGNGSACAQPDTYFLWDSVHPTATAHNAVGLALAASVPEPATWALFGLGLGMLTWQTLRQQGQRLGRRAQRAQA